MEICNLSYILAEKRPPSKGAFLFAFKPQNAKMSIKSMVSISGAIFYISVFMVVYVQVFFLITFLENRKKIVIRDKAIKLGHYPAVTIIVPCYNEEKTIYQSVRSLLNLNYPKDKVKLFLIDDGSTDGTWNTIQKFSKYSNVKVFRKENGGKYTALNLGLEHSETDFVGCLDADSTVDSEALVRIMSYFEKDAEAMAIAPSVVVNNPRGIVQNAQRVEYNMGIYFKKMLGFMGAINVTPGPFTIFRKKVFNDLGPYRHAHNTEDMEIAYRMQTNHYKIDHCNDAYVYTNTPVAVTKLYKQRLRWIYGFINNTIDYRKVLLNKKYGNFSLFTLPMGITSIFTVIFVFGKSLYSVANFAVTKFIQFQTVGFHPELWFKHFDLFFINIPTQLVITISIYSLIIFSIMLGRKMTEGTKVKWGFPYQVVFFLVVFSVVAPVWILKAVYNTLISRAPAWR